MDHFDDGIGYLQAIHGKIRAFVLNSAHFLEAFIILNQIHERKRCFEKFITYANINYQTYITFLFLPHLSLLPSLFFYFSIIENTNKDNAHAAFHILNRHQLVVNKLDVISAQHNHKFLHPKNRERELTELSRGI